MNFEIMDDLFADDYLGLEPSYGEIGSQFGIMYNS
jgi:hypothetical protein